MKKILPLISIFAISACVAPSTPPPPPTQQQAPQQVTVTPAPAPQPRPAGDWRDWPITPGDWVYRQDTRGSIALFGEAGQSANFMVRCDRAQKKIFLSRTGTTQRQARMLVRTTATDRNLPASNAGGTPPYIAAEVAVYDDILDKIAFSRGRFTVEVSSTSALAIPIWPEFTRVVEDCRK
ncbi:hypothetical protein [Sphingorhabdus sp. Alg239-R122]|uniref:hypothetical protein n=1 Tax=Sphingorhabdus sp. Alg239-R122 TaxID=2305989 RepID=UPI0013DA9A03|nr:hypothetical protein [Sphingorhabdus sp. Alg239-R122]